MIKHVDYAKLEQHGLCLSYFHPLYSHLHPWIRNASQRSASKTIQLPAWQSDIDVVT